MLAKLKHQYLRLRYWRQLRKGFALLEDHGAKRNFSLANGRLFIMNGVDPLVRVDLSTNIAEKYVEPDFFKLGTDMNKVNGHINVYSVKAPKAPSHRDKQNV